MAKELIEKALGWDFFVNRNEFIAPTTNPKEAFPAIFEESTKEDILARWKSLGFLEFLSEDKQQIAAENMEKISKCLYYFHVNVWAFPMIVKLIKENNVERINFNTLIETLLSTYLDIINNELGIKEDLEKELVEHATERYIYCTERIEDLLEKLTKIFG